MHDLRSDTVTRPDAAMRTAIAEAVVGDDVYREDPTVTRLEARAAAITGKEAALFVPTGTMANQVALLCHTRPGDEVITGFGSHCAYYESGAAGAWAGVQIEQVGQTGLFGVDEARAAMKPRAYYCPRTSLVVVENTHNRAGGRVFPQADVVALGAFCKEEELALHLDGARIWNAAEATGIDVATLCAPADSVSVCFSKGLGAPVGSALCGSRDLVERALRFRKMLGGGMRQVGMMAAGALHALEHNRAGLAADHAAAQQLAAALRAVDGVEVPEVETNIINVTTPAHAESIVAQARERGVWLSALDADRMRLVTHRDVVGSGFEEVVAILVAVHQEALGQT